MIRLTTLAVLFLSCSAEPRSPRIYNVLISSKKNLSPSHAQPVYEPVLRTTSLGYAFPPLIYHTSFIQNVPAAYINPDYSGYSLNQNGAIAQNNIPLPLPVSTQEVEYNRVSKSQNPEQINQENEQEVVMAQFNPYATNYINYLPKEEESEALRQNPMPILNEEETDPKRVIANLKRNPEIPDVPPPPLPVRVSAKAKQ